MDKKRKKGKAAIIILSVIIAVAAAAAAVYLFAFGTLTIVSDPAFSQVVPGGTIARLRLEYAMKGIRLRVKGLSDDCFRSRTLFSETLGRIRSDYVVLARLPQPMPSIVSLMSPISCRLRWSLRFMVRKAQCCLTELLSQMSDLAG